MYVAAQPSAPVDEAQRQQATPLLQAANLPNPLSALPQADGFEVNSVGTDHIIYAPALLALPADKKSALEALLASDKSDIVVISTPLTSQADLTAALAQAANGASINALKNVQLAAGTVSTSPLATSYAPHRALLPGLLQAHDDNTQGFSGVVGGGVVVTTSSSGANAGATTSVQWSLDGGKRIVTLLGYWRPGKTLSQVARCVLCCIHISWQNPDADAVRATKRAQIGEADQTWGEGEPPLNSNFSRGRHIFNA